MGSKTVMSKDIEEMVSFVILCPNCNGKFIEHIRPQEGDFVECSRCDEMIEIVE